MWSPQIYEVPGARLGQQLKLYINIYTLMCLSFSGYPCGGCESYNQGKRTICVFFLFQAGASCLGTNPSASPRLRPAGSRRHHAPPGAGAGRFLCEGSNTVVMGGKEKGWLWVKFLLRLWVLNEELNHELTAQLIVCFFGGRSGGRTPQTYHQVDVSNG